MPYATPLTPENKDLLARIFKDPGTVEVTGEELWRSRIRTQYELECCFFEAFFRNPKEPGKSGVLSIWALPQEERDLIRIQANIAWKRLDEVLRDYSAQNGPGIYEVRIDWGRVGWIASNDYDSAERSAETLYTWLRSVKRPEAPESCRMHVAWAYDPDETLLALLEKDLAETQLAGVREAEKRLADAKESLKWALAVRVVSPVTGT